MLADDEVRVYAYRADGSLGDPLATAAVEGYNLFAAAGHAFVKGEDDDAFLVFRWDGATLEARGECPMIGKKSAHCFSAAHLEGGVLALCCVDTKGGAHWFRFVDE